MEKKNIIAIGILVATSGLAYEVFQKPDKKGEEICHVVIAAGLLIVCLGNFKK